LTDAGVPANGSYDLSFALYDALSGGNRIGGPITNGATVVSNGLFVAQLDFGPAAFTGASTWLDIAVRTNAGDTFATLSPRQALTPEPYSIFAATASSVVAGSVVTSLNGHKDDVTLLPGANVTITPSGNSFTIAAAGVGGSGIWGLNGSSTYYNGGHVGIGTSSPGETLTIAGVGNYNTGLKLTGNSTGGTGLAIENTAAGGHKYSMFSASSADAIGAGGFGLYDDTSGTYRMAINANGKIGIGTVTPAAQLTVGGDWDGQQGALTLSALVPSLRLTGGLGTTIGTSWVMQEGADSTGNLEFSSRSFSLPDWSLALTLTPSGQVGIGTSNPQENLTIAGVSSYNNGLKLTGSTTAGAGLTLESTATGGHKYAIFSANTGEGVGAGGFGIYDDSVGAYRFAIKANGNVGIGTANPQSALDINGTTQTKILIITGGADVAEPFEMSGERLAEGSVVVIDEENPGQLKLSAEPYDTRVAGIISGANGIHPGIRLQQNGLIERGQNVALSGRVYVQADATFGSIRPGDLLTTSRTPGHAMKVTDHANAKGAILGKAMSGLKEGRGMVLVLVTLQ
jgi:uncharacterized protein YegP (UPF0339 family)